MSGTVAQWALSAYAFLLPLSEVVFMVGLLMIPLGIFRRARAFAGNVLYALSYVIGATLWFLGAGVTLGAWGFLALIAGLAFAGLGVVPLGIAAAFISVREPSMGFTMIAALVATLGFRLLGVSFLSRAVRERDTAGQTVPIASPTGAA
jgi:hypothetical protein